MFDLQKYPRTAHLVGSKLQVGDTTDGQMSLTALMAGTQVWEEKVDGSNVAISFSEDADLLLQSRGHYLTGGWREKQYNLFKRWANHHLDTLFDILGTRYIMFGEWCYAKHTVFYDRLPHYFLEFDIYDKKLSCFLSTTRRHQMLIGTPIVSVPIVHTGAVTMDKQLRAMIRPSLFKSETWRETMAVIARNHDLDPEQVIRETDGSSLCEGLYLKVEDEDTVVGRYKFIRSDFLQAILDSGSHWASRTILPNQLAEGVDIFARV